MDNTENVGCVPSIHVHYKSMSSRLGRERSGIFSSTNSDQNPVAARERKGKIRSEVGENEHFIVGTSHKL